MTIFFKNDENSNIMIKTMKIESLWALSIKSKTKYLSTRL